MRREADDAVLDMFFSLQNPGYAAMGEHARGYILEWTRGLFAEAEGGMAA